MAGQASSGQRVYFHTISKGRHSLLKWKLGSDALVYMWIQHPRANQELMLPIPAIEEAAPYLEPAFAHYIRQGRTCAGPEFDETDWKVVYFEPSEVPARIADPTNAPKLSEIVTRHAPENWLDLFQGGPVPALTDFSGPPKQIYGAEDDDPLELAEIEATAETVWDLAVQAWSAGFDRWVVAQFKLDA